MNINSSNIEPGVYEDADFSRDFAAAIRKGGQLCTPPAKTESPSGLAADSALGGCSSPYVPINPDMVIVRACDLKNLSMKLDAVISLRESGRAWKNTERVASLDLQKIRNCAVCLDDLIAEVIRTGGKG